MSIGYNLVLPSMNVYKLRVKDNEERMALVNRLCEQWRKYCVDHWLSDNHDEPYCAENRVKRFLDGLAYFMMIGDTKGIVTEYMAKANANREIPISSLPAFMEDLLYGGNLSADEEDINYLESICDKLDETAKETYMKNNPPNEGRSVYKITNRVNGKSYIGITINVGRRWRNHTHESRRGTERPLYEAMRQYGLDNFTVEVIDTAETAEELAAKERMYIKKYNTLFPDGYNKSPGGEISKSHKQPKTITKCTYDKVKKIKEQLRPKDFIFPIVDTDGNFTVNGAAYHVADDCEAYQPKQVKDDLLYDMDRVTVAVLPDNSLRFFDMNYEPIDGFVKNGSKMFPM